VANIPVNFEPFEPNARPETAQPTEEKPENQLVELEPRGVFRTIEIQLPDGALDAPPPAPAPPEDFFRTSASEPVTESAAPEESAPAETPAETPVEAPAAESQPTVATAEGAAVEPALVETPEVLEIQADASPKAVVLADDPVLETSSERLQAVPAENDQSGMLSQDESIRLLMDLAVLQEDLERAREQTQLAKRHVELVQEQLAKVTAERNAANESMVRLKAEFDNFRKRGEREKQEIAARAQGEVILSALEVLDNLERALTSGQAEGGDLEAFLHGVELIQKQFTDVLAGHGLVPVPAVGTSFDPTLHEAIATEETEDYKPNTVLEELKRGYTLGERLLRPAMVRVSVRPAVVATDDDDAE
jgi:molecular chaperone GrpE